MMAAHFLSDKGHDHENKPDVLTLAYRDALRWSIRHPWKTIGAGLAVFISSVALALTVPVIVIPRCDPGLMQMRVEIPPGTPVLDADRVLAADERAHAPSPRRCAAIFTTLNGVAGSAATADMYINLSPRAERNRSQLRYAAIATPVGHRSFPTTVPPSCRTNGRSRGSDISVQFVGDDPDAVNRAGERLAAAMNQIPFADRRAASSALRRPEIQVRPALRPIWRVSA